MSLNEYAQLYNDAGAQYGVDPALLMAQAEQESSGDPNAVGEPTKYGRAEGIAQLIPATAKSLGVTNPKDPKQAIPAQAKLMAENLKRYGDVNTALMAYHGGTDQKNWGEKTKAYPNMVLSKYKGKKMAANTEIDPLDEAYSSAFPTIGQTAPATVASSTIDPLDEAYDEAVKLRAEEKKKLPKKAPIGITEDLARTIPSSVVKGIGAIPQIPAMAGNAILSAVGYGVGKIAGVDEATQNKLNNSQYFFTGNTPFDALTQAGKAIISNDPGEQNPLTGQDLHDPETMPGRFANALTQGAIAGPATGIRLAPSLTGAIGAEGAMEVLPDNPLAPLVGGFVGGVAPQAVRSMRLRATPEEMAANVIKSQADPGNALNPSGEFSFVGEKPIIPGIKNTLAEATQDPGLALVQRQMENKPAFRDQENANENIRQEHFGKASGTAQDIEAMEAAREAQRKVDTDAIFKPDQVADSQPVVKKIDEILNGPGGERSAVKNSLTKIRDMIAKEKDGEVQFEGNPEKLYRSVKHEIEDMMDKKNLNNPEGRQAAAELNQVKKVLDDVIDKGTPGYKKYLENYSSASKQIDAANWLQNLKLTDAGGKYTLAKVKNALENAKKLQKSRGLNEAKSITPEQMKILQSLHDDLLRREKPMRESMSRGSPTKQNLLAQGDMNSALGQANHLLGGKGPEMMGAAAGTTVGSAFGAPGAGAFIGDLAVRYLKAGSEKRTARANNRLEEFMRNPATYKDFLLRNQENTFSNRLLNHFLTDEGKNSGPLRLTIRPSDKKP